MEKVAGKELATNHKSRLWRGGFGFRKGDIALYVMLIPYVLYMLIFLYKPMWGLQIAFKDYSLFGGMEDSAWVGLENFKTFLTGPYCGRLIKNTLLIGFYGLIFGFPIPIILAILLNEVKNHMFKKSIQTMMYLPYFVSTVVVAGIVTNILAPSGLVNTVLEKFGMESIYFMTEPKWFRTIYTAMTIWQSAGYSAVIYLAALSGVDVQLYEACRIDGGNKMRQMWHITLPGIAPTVVIMLIMNCGSLINVGSESIILLYQPTTYETADVISSYIYRIGLTDGDYGLATAVGLFNSAIALLFVYLANTISKHVSEYSLW